MDIFFNTFEIFFTRAFIYKTGDTSNMHLEIARVQISRADFLFRGYNNSHADFMTAIILAHQSQSINTPRDLGGRLNRK